jgi:hypothetical protein
MTLAVRKRLARKARGILSNFKEFELVAVTEPLSGFYHIQIITKNQGSATLPRWVAAKLLENMLEIFSVDAQLNEAGYPQLVFHATSR